MLDFHDISDSTPQSSLSGDDHAFGTTARRGQNRENAARKGKRLPWTRFRSKRSPAAPYAYPFHIRDLHNRTPCQWASKGEQHLGICAEVPSPACHLESSERGCLDSADMSEEDNVGQVSSGTTPGSTPAKRQRPFAKAQSVRGGALQKTLWDPLMASAEKQFTSFLISSTTSQVREICSFGQQGQSCVVGEIYECAMSFQPCAGRICASMWVLVSSEQNIEENAI